MSHWLKNNLHLLMQAQKAKEREEDEHLVDKLDSDFASLAQSQVLLSMTESAKGKVNRNDTSIGLTGKEIFNKVVIFLNHQL
jgi:nucleolar protein 14